jgi:hypothetical protein
VIETEEVSVGGWGHHRGVTDVAVREVDQAGAEGLEVEMDVYQL